MEKYEEIGFGLSWGLIGIMNMEIIKESIERELNIDIIKKEN